MYRKIQQNQLFSCEFCKYLRTSFLQNTFGKPSVTKRFHKIDRKDSIEFIFYAYHHLFFLSFKFCDKFQLLHEIIEMTSPCLSIILSQRQSCDYIEFP